MEALESNMWSTMQRAPKSTPASSSSSGTSNTTSTSSRAGPSTSVESANSNVGSYVAPTVPAAPTVDNSQQNLPVPPAPATSTTATTTGASNPPVTSAINDNKSTAEPSATLDPFDLELEDKEDNEIIDKYANFISEVRVMMRFFAFFSTQLAGVCIVVYVTCVS